MERQKRFGLALLFILIGMITLCAGGANLLGQAPPPSASGALAQSASRTTGVSAFVLFGVSIVALLIGFLLFFKLTREEK